MEFVPGPCCPQGWEQQRLHMPQAGVSSWGHTALCVSYGALPPGTPPGRGLLFLLASFPASHTLLCMWKDPRELGPACSMCQLCNKQTVQNVTCQDGMQEQQE